MNPTKPPTASHSKTPPAPATAALLSNDKDSYRVDEAAVRAIKPPTSTATWHPISHSFMLDQVEAAMQERGLIAERRDFSISHDKHQFFGIYTMRGDAKIAKDFTLALGLRNSTNKTLPAGICSGARVIVCDNLMLTGDIVLKRKHTTGIETDMPLLIRQAMDAWYLKAVAQAKTFNDWKHMVIEVPEATDFIVRAADVGAIPQNSILRIRKEFLEPRHEEFRGNTAWTLYNAFTQYLTHGRTEITPAKMQKDYLSVHQLMATEFPCLN